MTFVYEASTNESVCRTRVKPGMLASRHLKLRAAIGDGASALQTPLVRLHAFNGWADTFASTPVDGLEDRYALATGKFGSGRLQEKLSWTIAWQDYRADRGGDRYGSEWDDSLGFPLPGGLMGLLKLADYQSDGFARDPTKAWLQVEWSY